MKDKFLTISILKNEERALTKIASHIQDYLTRLKVNELTILSQMKERTMREQENSCILLCTSHAQEPMYHFGTAVNDQPLTDLDLKVDTIKKNNEEEEEDDDVDNAVGFATSMQEVKIDPSTCMDQLQEFLNSSRWTFPQMNVNEDDDDYNLDLSGIVRH